MQLLESGLGNERAKLGPGLHGCMGARGLDGYELVNVNPQDLNNEGILIGGTSFSSNLSLIQGYHRTNSPGLFV